MSADNMVVGVDPGIHGALAVVDRTSRRVVAMHDMPVTVSAGGDQVVCEVGLWRLVESLRPHLFVVEEVSAVQKASSKSSFNFGRGFGLILMATEAASVRRTFVKPVVWKRALGIHSSKVPKARKALALQRANQVFPGQGSEFWPRFSDNDKAEAALIAYWGCDHA